MRGQLIAATVALCLSFQTAGAQRVQSLEAGFLTAFEDAVFQVGYRTTGLKPGGARFDFAIATLPEGFAESLFLLVANLDLTYGIPIGTQAWLLPRAGGTALVGVGEGGGGGALGLNIGIGLLGRVGERNGLRLDVTHMRFLGGVDEDDLGITALTFGWAWIK